MHELAQRLLRTIRKEGLIKAGDRLAVAVSGGADSVALLLLLLELRPELGIVLSVAHVNHQLRGGESDEDEQFVAELAQQRGLEIHTCKAPLTQPHSGVEAAARKLRYDFFQQLAGDARVSKIATAHTLDDQAETILLRMMRGTGIRGLAGIHPRVLYEDRGEVVRPLLGFRRVDLQAFLQERKQPWREDSSNQDQRFLRNRVRQRLLPLLKEEFGAATLENIADLAEIARAEEEHWEVGHPEIRNDAASVTGKIAVRSLLTLPLAAQRRLIREWLEASADNLAVSFRLIEEVRDLAGGAAGNKLELPGGHVVRQAQGEVCFERIPDRAEVTDYEYRLLVPGTVAIRELGVRIEAVLGELESVPEGEREHLLDPAQLPLELSVRNWRPGDRFWPAHTKEEKKVKELLGNHHLTGRTKRLWPVAVAHGLGLVWMRDFSTPASLQPPAGTSRALLIRVLES